jgi:hypothetical protein
MFQLTLLSNYFNNTKTETIVFAYKFFKKAKLNSQLKKM